MRPVLAIVLLASLPILPSSAAAQSARALEQRVDSLLASQVSPGGPGCAIGVYRDGRVVFARGYGVSSIEDGRAIDASTTFNLGSAAKPFTALAALLLEQQGRLSLDDDVRRWVPELPEYGSVIRVQDLLQHSSGLRDYGALQVLSRRDITTMDDFLAALAAQRALHFAPGTEHEYSHSDFVLLALVIERVTAQPFAEHLRRTVLEPLGMGHAFVDDGRAGARRERAFGHVGAGAGSRVHFPDDFLVGGSSLYASVNDLAAWDRELATGSVGGATIARMLSRPTLPNGDTVPYAYGLRLGEHRGLRTVSRGGHVPGVSTEYLRFPDQQLGVATLCNTEAIFANQLARNVADVYLGDAGTPPPARPQPPRAVALSTEELQRYVGFYRSRFDADGLLPIMLHDGALGEVLFHEVHDDTLYTMHPAGDGVFFEIGSTGNVGVLTFRDTPGEPMLLEIAWNGELADRLDRVPDSLLWSPSAADLAAYAGTWYSEELDVAWRFTARGDRLVLQRRGERELTPLPVERDRFLRGLGSLMDEEYVVLQFARDAAGRVTHMSAGTPRGRDPARDIRFFRVARE